MSAYRPGLENRETGGTPHPARSIKLFFPMVNIACAARPTVILDNSPKLDTLARTRQEDSMLNVRFVRRSVRSMFVLGMALASALATVPSAAGQTFHVIHSFSGTADGSIPNSTMILDQAGNLYGTTSYGGAQPGNAGSGIVFKLVKRNSSWVLTPTYTLDRKSVV